jgi:hypothetical protein
LFIDATFPESSKGRFGARIFCGRLSLYCTAEDCYERKGRFYWGFMHQPLAERAAGTYSFVDRGGGFVRVQSTLIPRIYPLEPEFFKLEIEYGKSSKIRLPVWK